jgi:hypothetical protein
LFAKRKERKKERKKVVALRLCAFFASRFCATQSCR